MFYSHQLLARKAPLGQIWMAATLHAKLNRRKLDKLNIIKICEEILNPSVPMALRLSGILMGGVVIVYEKKVKLLYDDVNQLLVEINEAWRVKKPKKTKYDAVTLPKAKVVEMEMDQSIPMSNATATARARYQNQDFRMQLDELEDEYIQINYNDSSQSMHQHHQADPQNITLLDEMDSFLPTENDMYNRFESFDIYGDDEELQFTQDERKDEFTINPSPPPQKADEFVTDHHMEEPQEDQMANEIRSEAQEDQMANEIRSEAQEAQQDEQKPRIGTRGAKRKVNTLIMDNEHLILPGNVYQTWLQDTSDILKKRRRKIKQPNPILSGKIVILMELPPTTLYSYIESFPSEICYPDPLIELWKEITKPDIDSNSSSGEKTDRQEQEPFVHSPPPEFPGENFNTEIDSASLPEEMRILNFEGTNLNSGNSGILEGTNLNSGNSGGSVSAAAFNPNSGSGPTKLSLDPSPQLDSGRSSKRRQHSLSGNSLGNLDPVEEDVPENGSDPILPRVSENGSDPDFVLCEETGPTQTPHGNVTDTTPMDEITEQIKTHLKTHFTAPGAPSSESLDQLTSGMNRRNASQLFYKICVLANGQYIKVDQEVAYGEISISKGPKM